MLSRYVGNGFVATHPIVGTQGGVHGAYRGHTIFMGGVFNAGQYSQNRSHRAAIPGFTTEIELQGNVVNDVEYSLDVRRAVLSKRWHAGGLSVEEEHYAHRQRRNLLIHTIHLANNGLATLNVSVKQLAGPPCGGPYGCDVSMNEIASRDASTVRLLNGSILTAETPQSPLISIGMASTVLTEHLQLAPGENTIMLSISALSSSLDSSHPLRTAERALAAAAATGPKELLTEHIAAWGELWKSGLEVGGDEELARAINGSQYYILSSIREDWPYGLSPGGLASGGYHGHTFWCACLPKSHRAALPRIPIVFHYAWMLFLTHGCRAGTRRAGCGRRC